MVLATFLTAFLVAAGAAQQALVPVRPIRPPTDPLPAESASAGVTRFSFIAYGDTRSQVDGTALQPDHGAVISRMLTTIASRASTAFPVKFVLHSGDAVVRGQDGAQWNVSFSPLVEHLTQGAGLPYFFTIGNHDGPEAPDGTRTLGVHNALAAMSQLTPGEGSPRRLNGYMTYAFGYGNLMALAIDSNIAPDKTQLAWVADQLEHLDRRRYPHVVVFFHHPVFSSGPHGGTAPGPAAGTMAEGSVEPPTAALRRFYAPLFRRHHVRMTISGHDHLFDHFVERHVLDGVSYRRDDVVSGGGGAPIYSYRGEPELGAYLAAGASQRVRVQHLVRPGATPADNPHHFIVIQVDGDRLSLEVVGAGPAEFQPYGGRSRIELTDP